MPEFRKDPFAERWVVIAPDRANRPIQLSDVDPVFATSLDPFAEGNEALTPPEAYAVRSADSCPNGPGWRVRVIPNKYPAVETAGELQTATHGLYEAMNGVGIHEVIVECPHDESNLARLSVANIRDVLGAYQNRILHVKGDARFVHALIFKNYGVFAGASLRHAHSQLIATPVIPIAIHDEIQSTRAFYDRNGNSLSDALLRQELEAGSRIVLDSEHFVVICPYASRFPFESWVLPRRQTSHFENITDGEIDDLGTVLKTSLQKLERGLNDPPYNYVIHTAPLNAPELPWFRWRIEILPRLTRIAGFEWGSGFYINHMPPEASAKLLREIEI
jgi:UDPglucose--hexose-1-phosphate uridylyltransferase